MENQEKTNQFRSIVKQLNTNHRHHFLHHHDDTARLINDRANHLYIQLLQLDINNCGIDAYAINYFSAHHGGNRLFFSIQSSAHIIYQSVKITGKPFISNRFMDYGAGLGTLFLLAGKVGFKAVYFNDYFPQWAGYAKIICNKLDITVDDYVTGDIDAVIAYCHSKDIVIDIMASRNVLEHIYKPRDFYSKLYQSGITNLCYATTTANYHNPVMRVKLYRHHYKLEKILYEPQRKKMIQELVPGINNRDLTRLIRQTRGRAFEDFTRAVNLYQFQKSIPPVEFLRTNTCDCTTGVWAENLMTKKNYYDIIGKAGFEPSFTAGFWDTHYKWGSINVLTGLLNKLITLFGNKGYWFAPFVNITAIKK